MGNKDIEEIIDGLLKLQNLVLGDKPADEWVYEKAQQNIGNVAQIVVHENPDWYLDPFNDPGVTVRLELDPNLKIKKTDKHPKHEIHLHIDTLIDLLDPSNEDFDLRKAYARGLIVFRGEDYHLHAMLWAESFERLRWLIKEYGGRIL